MGRRRKDSTEVPETLIKSREEGIISKAQADALLNDLSLKAARTLSRLMDSENEKTALTAAQAVLDRAFGKPITKIENDVSGGVTIGLALERQVRAAVLHIDATEEGSEIESSEGTGTPRAALPEPELQRGDSEESESDKGSAELVSKVSRPLFRR